MVVCLGEGHLFGGKYPSEFDRDIEDIDEILSEEADLMEALIANMVSWEEGLGSEDWSGRVVGVSEDENLNVGLQGFIYPWGYSLERRYSSRSSSACRSLASIQLFSDTGYPNHLMRYCFFRLCMRSSMISST